MIQDIQTENHWNSPGKCNFYQKWDFFMYYIANLLFPGIPVPGKLQLSGKFPTLFTEWFMYGCWKRFLLYKFFDTKTFFELWVSSKLPRIHSFILSARKMPTAEKVVFDFCYCCCILLLVMPKFYLRNSSQKPSFNTTDLCIHSCDVFPIFQQSTWLK